MPRTKLIDIIQKNPSLIWYVHDTSKISDESIMEHVLNYGTWDQVQEIIAILGPLESKNLYESLANKPRSNLLPRVKHFFNLYFSNEHRDTN